MYRRGSWRGAHRRRLLPKALRRAAPPRRRRWPSRWQRPRAPTRACRTCGRSSPPKATSRPRAAAAARARAVPGAARAARRRAGLIDRPGLPPWRCSRRLAAVAARRWRRGATVRPALAGARRTSLGAARRGAAGAAPAAQRRNGRHNFGGFEMLRSRSGLGT
eukprot:3145080-Pleurochrysis_carterae.AAC.4